MSVYSKKRKELKFQSLWEFRRGNSVSAFSADDSKSSLAAEAAPSKNKTVSSLVPADNDEPSDQASRFQQKNTNDHCISGQFEIGKAEKGKKGRSEKDNSKKRGAHCLKEVSQKKSKSKTTAQERAALDDLNNYMNSLLEEHKVGRKNLLSWMREEMLKLMDEEKASESEMEEDKVQLQHQNNLEENAGGADHCHNISGKNIQVQQDPNSLDDNNGVQPSDNSKENVQKRIPSCPGARIPGAGSLNRFGNNKKSAGSNSYIAALEAQLQHLPSVLTKPHSANHRPDTYSFSYIQPRTTQNQTGNASERSNLMMGSTSHHLVYFQGMQPEGRSRYNGQMICRDIGLFSHNNATSSVVGSGFTVPQQSVNGGFSLLNQFDTLGLTMNGGAIRFSGAGYIHI